MPESKIREYTREQARIAASNARMFELEAQVEDEERRNLRLTRELHEEVALRARAESLQQRQRKQIEDLTNDLEEAKGKLNELSGPPARTPKSRQRTKPGGEVSDGVQRVDGSTAPKRKRNPKSADSISPDGTTGSPPVPQSSRKRGNVK